MGGSKLKTIHVVIIGCFACVVVAVGVYFLIIKKSCARIDGLNARYQQAQQVWQRKASVEAQLEAAKQEYRLVKWEYEKYEKEKMPSVSLQDRAQGMIALWKEQAEVLGPMLQSWPDKTGVTLRSDVSVPAAPVNPNSVDPSIIRIPIGSFRVTGDFRTILSHIKSWNKFNRLVQIDFGGLTGPSPGMTAEYTLTVYIFPQGEAGPNVAMAGGGGGQAGAGMTGMPGMPGGMDAPPVSNLGIGGQAPPPM